MALLTCWKSTWWNWNGFSPCPCCLPSRQASSNCSGVICISSIKLPSIKSTRFLYSSWICLISAFSSSIGTLGSKTAYNWIQRYLTKNSYYPLPSDFCSINVCSGAFHTGPCKKQTNESKTHESSADIFLWIRNITIGAFLKFNQLLCKMSSAFIVFGPWSGCHDYKPSPY